MIPARVRTTTGRAALLAAALLLLPACAGDTTASPAPTETVVVGGEGATPSPSTTAAPAEEHDGHAAVQVDVQVAGGEVRGVADRVEVPLGSPVRLTVTSDAADEAHVHGYDRTLALRAGVPATLEFTADIPGVFEVELHDSGTPLTSLQVQ